MITDLPAELLLIIYENLEPKQLLNDIAVSHPVNQRLVEMILKKKFREKVLQINEFGLFILNDIGKSDYVGDMDTMYSVLKTYGHLFRKLNIDYINFRQWECGQINKRINKYVANSLTEITLTRFGSKHFKHLNVPFKNVEILEIEDCCIPPNVIKLNELFPSVRVLQLKYNGKLHPSAIEHHFPQLEEIKETYYDNDAKKLKNLLQLNPQIRRLSIQKTDWSLLKTISEILPQLEYLYIYRLDGQPAIEGDIHFKNLKFFKLSFQYPHLTQLPITFGESLEEFIDLTADNALFDLILRNKNLKKVLIYGSYVQIQRIAEELPKLEEFMIGLNLDDKSVVNKVVQFIETAKNLKIFKLRDSFQRIYDAILKRLSSEWEIGTEAYQNYATFIRRNKKI